MIVYSRIKQLKLFTRLKIVLAIKKKNFNHNKPCDQEKKTKHLNLFFSKARFAVFALKKSYFLKKNKLLFYIYRLLLFVFFASSAIYRGLSLTNFWHWIGLTDQESEGNFRWLNGERASSTDDNFWYLGQPDGDSDCCLARFDFVFPNTYEWPCSQAQYGLCEKPV